MIRRATWLGLAVLVSLAGCGINQQEPAPAKTSYHHYVALGDTFTAAPYTGTTRGDRGCRRSDANYPTLLGRALGIDDVTDVSCHLARASSVRQRQVLGNGRIPPQLDAVRRDTDLVTINLGGNDHDLFALVANACTPGGAGCLMTRYEPTLVAIIDTVRQSLDAAIRAVQDRAPDARIVVVGYPRHVSRTSRCPAQPKMTEADRLAWLRVDRGLNTAASSAARDTGADFIDVFAASWGHDTCARAPWVRGKATSRAKAGLRAGIAFGPTATEQTAVADMIQRELKTPPV